MRDLVISDVNARSTLILRGSMSSSACVSNRAVRYL